MVLEMRPRTNEMLSRVKANVFILPTDKQVYIEYLLQINFTNQYYEI